MDELDELLGIDPATLQIEELPPVISKKKPGRKPKVIEENPKSNLENVDLKIEGEKPLDAIHRICKECYGDYYDILELTDEIRSLYSYGSEFKYQVSLKFEEFNINNNTGRTHFIHGIYVIFFLDSTFKIRGALRGFRHKITKSEIISNYGHSHLSDKTSLQYWKKNYCLGDPDTAIFKAFIDYREATFNEARFRKLLITIMGYIQYESLEGGPYNRIQNLLSYTQMSAVTRIESSVDEYERLSLMVNSPASILPNTFAGMDYLSNLKRFSISVLNYLKNKNYLTYTIENDGNSNSIKLNLTVKDIEDIYLALKAESWGNYFDRFEVLKANNEYYSINRNGANNEHESKINDYRSRAKSTPLILSTGKLHSVIVDDLVQQEENLSNAVNVLHPLISVNVINHIKQLFIQYKLNKK